VTALVPARRWPAEVEPGWLTGLLAVEGVGAVAMRVRPLARGEAMTFMTIRLRQVRAADRLAAEQGELVDVERERVGDTAMAARRSVHAGRGRIYLVDTVLFVEGDEAPALAERVESLRLEGRGLGLELDVATFRLTDAWRAALPGPAPRPIAERNLDSGSLAASLLHAASDLYEPSGHLYGRARTSGAPIVLDRFAHASHNAIVLGQTGTGKTMFTGAEMSRCLIRGIRVLAVDPLDDYRRLTDELGGTYVELGAGGVGLNPFAFTGMATDGALTAKIAALTRLVAAMAGGIGRDERPALDRALRATYEAAGIGPDPATLDRPAPTLADLTARLGGLDGGAALAHRLERWATGSLAHLFAGASSLPLEGRLIVIGLASLSDPEVRAVAQLAALSLLWDAVRRDLAPKLIVVDEAWKVMRQPAGAEFIEELARSARHYHAGLQLATQDIVEFLRSDFGESIVKQSDLRVLLGQTPEGADALARYFDLTAAERRSLVHARPGEGLLFVGRSHVAFTAAVSRREYAALTTRPADLLAALQRYAPPDTG
jgi:type IV secretory pathway VirB4 component